MKKLIEKLEEELKRAEEKEERSDTKIENLLGWHDKAQGYTNGIMEAIEILRIYEGKK